MVVIYLPVWTNAGALLSSSYRGGGGCLEGARLWGGLQGAPPAHAALAPWRQGLSRPGARPDPSEPVPWLGLTSPSKVSVHAKLTCDADTPTLACESPQRTAAAADVVSGC